MEVDPGPHCRRNDKDDSAVVYAEGSRTLDEAAIRGHKDVVEPLVSWGTYVDAVDKWEVIGRGFTSESPITAVSRTSTVIDLFTCGSDGMVYTARWKQGTGWPHPDINWVPVGGEFSAGTPVSVIVRTPTNLDLFVCGNDGKIYTSSWSEDIGWSQTWDIIGWGFPKGCYVSAISRIPSHINVFICGQDRRVYTSEWKQDAGWSKTWRSIGGFFLPGARISALSRMPNIIDLFICGNTGRVYTCWWVEGGDWSGMYDNCMNIGGFFPPLVTRALQHRSLYLRL